MSGAALIRGDAIRLPLADASVDLIVTSPPYFALRSYRDGGEHYEGQIGSEATTRAFLEALWAVTAECWRVLKPSGSMFVNLGDKYAGSGGHNNATLSRHGTGSSTLERAGKVAERNQRATRRTGPDRYIQDTGGARPKSLMLLPETYRMGAAGVWPFEHGMAAPEGQRWLARAVIEWSKPNGLPDPTVDRVRRSHEDWVHLTKQGSYFSSIDPIREPHSENTHARRSDGQLPPKDQRGVADGVRNPGGYFGETTFNPLGRAPGSVWTIASEPLVVPEHLGIDHFAAFPQEWPRRLILGWSPVRVCTACGEGRKPTASVVSIEDRRGRVQGREGDSLKAVPGRTPDGRAGERYKHVVEIDGTACACPDQSSPSRPAVVLDPFVGTGTVPMVARAFGRYGVGVDLSADYLRLARWRVWESGHAAKSRERTNREAQTSLDLLGEAFGGLTEDVVVKDGVL